MEVQQSNTRGEMVCPDLSFFASLAGEVLVPHTKSSHARLRDPHCSRSQESIPSHVQKVEQEPVISGSA